MYFGALLGPHPSESAFEDRMTASLWASLFTLQKQLYFFEFGETGSYFMAKILSGFWLLAALP